MPRRHPLTPATHLRGFAVDILRLAESLSDKLIVIDRPIWSFGMKACKHVADFDNVILLKTCSKAFGLAAIRLGFAVANRRLSRAIAAIKSPYNVNTMTNVAGSIVLSHADYLKDCIRQIREQRDKLYCMLKEVEKERGGIKVYSSCANFVLVECPDASGVYGKLLQRGIAVRQQGTSRDRGQRRRACQIHFAFKEAL